MVSPTKFEYEDAFFDHIMKYDLNFENSDHFSRVFMAFCDNYNKILEHNAKDLPFTLALNRFSHLTLSGTDPSSFILHLSPTIHFHQRFNPPLWSWRDVCVARVP